MANLPDMDAFGRLFGQSAWGGGGGPSIADLTETQAFGANPGELRMLSYVPPGLAAKAPLVVTLHGCGQSAEEYAKGAGWVQLAQRLRFAVLSPEQGSGNNPNRCFNWFGPQDTRRGAGEAASIRRMVEVMVEAHDLDPARIFVTGLSAGGAMTAVMLADYPEVFAGGGVIAGLPYGAADNVKEALGAMFQGRTKTPSAWGGLVRAASPHNGPWPRVSIWQGDADATVKAVNADALAAQWVDVHGLTTSSRSESPGRAKETWYAPDGSAAVELHAIAGLGHGTPLSTHGPEGSGLAGPHLIETGVSSSLELAVFWGLAEASALTAQPAPAVSAAAAPAPVFTGRAGIDINAVITKALTAAKLLK